MKKFLLTSFLFVAFFNNGFSAESGQCRDCKAPLTITDFDKEKTTHFTCEHNQNYCTKCVLYTCLSEEGKECPQCRKPAKMLVTITQPPRESFCVKETNNRNHKLIIIGAAENNQNFQLNFNLLEGNILICQLSENKDGLGQLADLFSQTFLKPSATLLKRWITLSEKNPALLQPLIEKEGPQPFFVALQKREKSFKELLPYLEKFIRDNKNSSSFTWLKKEVPLLLFHGDKESRQGVETRVSFGELKEKIGKENIIEKCSLFAAGLKRWEEISPFTVTRVPKNALEEGYTSRAPLAIKPVDEEICLLTFNP